MNDLLTGALPPVSIGDMITEVERELKLRETFYPRWVSTGKLKQSTADEHMRRMRASIKDMMDTPDADARKQYDAIEFTDMNARNFDDDFGTRQGYSELLLLMPLAYYDFMLRVLADKVDEDLRALGVEL